ncbi:recombinase family protein [Vibrio coralliirubri]|uniref:recombinase family protein n=1 Tax=Vibrio coralliirubri TaxID=1516159 RepID=UPI002166B414|nr:recombinase family protein [Vibrio coralliirubri]
MVRLMLELRLQGLAFNKIALKINNQGFTKPNGSAWQTGNVSSICKNKAVIGICSTKYGDIKDVYPPVITEADFNEINKEKLNHFATGKKSSFEQNLFADLGKCHLCNSAISKQTKESYVCSGRYHGNNCHNQSIPLKALEHAVIQIMFNQLEQNQIFSTSNESELQKLRLDLSKFEHEYNELEHYIDSQASVSPRLLIELDKRQKELEELKTKINVQDSAIVSEFTELQVNYRDILSDKALRVKAKKLLRRLLDKVTYEKHDKLKFYVVLHFKTTSEAMLIEVSGYQEKHKFGQGQRPISYHYKLMHFEQDIETSIAWYNASTATIGFIRYSDIEQFSDVEKNLCMEAFKLEKQSKKTS